jgi:hypothetical protein
MASRERLTSGSGCQAADREARPSGMDSAVGGCVPMGVGPFPYAVWYNRPLC